MGYWKSRKTPPKSQPFDKAKWIEEQIAKKNERKARLPIVEFELGTSMLGETEIVWIASVRDGGGKSLSFVKKILRKNKKKLDKQLL